MLQSRDVIFMEDKSDVEKPDCTQENFQFFTGSVGNTENNAAECNNDAPKNGSIKDPQAAIFEEAERHQRARRPPDRLNVLTGDQQNLIDTAPVATVNTEEPTTTEEILKGERQFKVNTIH